MLSSGSTASKPVAIATSYFRLAHWGGDDALAGKYILERRPTRAASDLFERNRPLQHWLVRYYRSLDKEEAVVSVHPETGKVLGFDHTIPEDRPGADLTPERARAIAVAFASAMGWDLGAMDLKESTLREDESAPRSHSGVGGEAGRPAQCRRSAFPRDR